MKQRIVSTLVVLLVSICAYSSQDVFRDIALELASAGGALPGKTVAVVPFEAAVGQDGDFARYASEKITHELVLTGKLTVVERSKIARVMGEQEFSASGAMSADSVSKLGKLLAVDALVFGTVSRASGGSELLVRMIDIRTGSILKSVARTVASADAGSTARREGGERRGWFFRDRPKTAGTAEATREIKDDEEAKGALADLHLVEQGRVLYINGRVGNSGRAVLENPNITLSFLSSDGRQVAVARLFGDRHINPGETLPVRGILTPGPKGYQSYRAYYDPQPDRFSSFIESISSSQERFGKGSLGSYELSGMITNPNGYPVKLVKIIVSLFDAQGKFIGSAYGFSGAKRLSPGESAPYTVNIYPYSLSGQPKRYQLHFAALKD